MQSAEKVLPLLLRFRHGVVHFLGFRNRIGFDSAFPLLQVCRPLPNLLSSLSSPYQCIDIIRCTYMHMHTNMILIHIDMPVKFLSI